MFSRIDWILVILIVSSVIFYLVVMCLDLKVNGSMSLTSFTQAYFIKLSR